MRTSRFVQATLLTLAAAAAACGLSIVGTTDSADGGAGDASSERRSSSSSTSSSSSSGGSSSGDPGPVDSSSATTDSSSPGTDAGADTGVDSATSDASAPCPEATGGGNGKIFGGHCYFTIPLNLSTDFYTAKALCAAANAHLAAITTKDEHDFAQTVDGENDRWIGLEQDTPTNDRAQFHWITNETPVPDFWQAGQPNEMSLCGVMTDAGEWADRKCTNAYDALCERE